MLSTDVKSIGLGLAEVIIVLYSTNVWENNVSESIGHNISLIDNVRTFAYSEGRWKVWKWMSWTCNVARSDWVVLTVHVDAGCFYSVFIVYSQWVVYSHLWNLPVVPILRSVNTSFWIFIRIFWFFKLGSFILVSISHIFQFVWDCISWPHRHTPKSFLVVVGAFLNIFSQGFLSCWQILMMEILWLHNHVNLFFNSF